MTQGDAADFFAQGRTAEELRGLIAAAKAEGAATVGAPSADEAEGEEEEGRSSEWRKLIEADPLDDAELPYYLNAMVQHILPFTNMFKADWRIMACLPYFGALWPRARFQNLNLDVWWLGLSRQGVGKNLATDDLTEVLRQVLVQLRAEALVYTAGTPEGMWKFLAGEGKQLLAYIAEFGGFLKLLRRSHMDNVRESLATCTTGAW